MTCFKTLFVEVYSISSKVIRRKNYGPIQHQFFQRSKSTSDDFGKSRKTEWKSKRAKEESNKKFIDSRIKADIRQNSRDALLAQTVFASDPSLYYFSDMKKYNEKILKESNEILNFPMTKFKDILHEYPVEDLSLFIFALSKLPQESLIENFW